MAKQALVLRDVPAGLLDVPVPAGFTDANNMPDPGSSTPYVVFASTKNATQWAKLSAAVPGLTEGDIVLMMPDSEGGPVRLSQMNFFALQAVRYLAELGADYKPKRVVLHEPDGMKINGDCPNGVKLCDTVEALILILDGETITPATCRFSRARSKVGGLIDKTAKMVESSEWLKKSPEHAATGQIPVPFGRYVVQVTNRPRIATTGGKYGDVMSSVRPTTAAEAGRLISFLKDPSGQSALGAVKDAYKKHLDDVMAKVVPSI